MTDLITALLLMAGVTLWFWAPPGIYYVVLRFWGGTILMVFAAAIQLRSWR